MQAMDTLFKPDGRRPGRLYARPAQVVCRRTGRTVTRRRVLSAHVDGTRTIIGYLDGVVRTDRSPLSNGARRSVRPIPGLSANATRLPTIGPIQSHLPDPLRTYRAACRCREPDRQ